MRTFAAFVCALALTLSPVVVSAHSGGTDAQGCHTDSSTGTRHCHGGGGGGSGGGGGEVDESVIVISVMVGVVALIVLIYLATSDGGGGSRQLADAPEFIDDFPVQVGSDGMIRIDF